VALAGIRTQRLVAVDHIQPLKTHFFAFANIGPQQVSCDLNRSHLTPTVGEDVGDWVGENEGKVVGLMEGDRDGDMDGDADGIRVGEEVRCVGAGVGRRVLRVGANVGTLVFLGRVTPYFFRVGDRVVGYGVVGFGVGDMLGDCDVG